MLHIQRYTVCPPSITMACPTTKAASSEHSQTAAAAISSGCPMRPTGIPGDDPLPAFRRAAGEPIFRGAAEPRVCRGSREKLRLITEGAVLTATLDDNAATRDFVSLLPLSLTLRDYAGTER